MYLIDSDFDTPDIDYLFSRAEDCMDAGIRIKDASALYAEAIRNRNNARENLENEFGIVNPNSSDQVHRALERLQNSILNDALFDESKCDWTTSKDKLKRVLYETDGKEDVTSVQANSFVVGLMQFRVISKYAAYIEKFKALADRNGFIHPKISRGSTNRIQCSEPPLMSIPKKIIWNVLGPRSEGASIYSVDIKNQEPWILINYLGIEKLKSVLRISDTGSLYDDLFSLLYERDCGSIEHAEFKMAWNALTYGCSKKAVKAMCYCVDGETIWNYFKEIPEYVSFKKRCSALAARRSLDTTTLFGTPLKLAYGNISQLTKRHMNYPVQGTGVDILALLVQHFDEEIEERGLVGYLSLYYTKHDECLVEVSRTYKENHSDKEIKELLNDIFSHQIDDWPPFKLEIEEVKPTNIFTVDMDEEEE